jgi:hypothetical protein
LKQGVRKNKKTEARDKVQGTRVKWLEDARKKRGQDKDPASFKIQYPMKNHNKDVVYHPNAAYFFHKSF